MSQRRLWNKTLVITDLKHFLAVLSPLHLVSWNYNVRAANCMHNRNKTANVDKHFKMDAELQRFPSQQYDLHFADWHLISAAEQVPLLAHIL